MGSLKNTIGRAWNKLYVIYITPRLEKTFASDQGDAIHYLFYPKRRCKTLAVIFQAYDPAGPRYNYVTTLKDIPANRLYIKDDFFLPCGDFYLGKNGTYSIEKGVHRLIEKTIKSIGTREEVRLIFIGSSKGGYAAVNFGIAYPHSTMIVAAPMYYLGDYMHKSAHFSPALKEIVGVPVTEEKISRLDRRLPEKVKANPNAKTQRAHIHCSENDSNYPFVMNMAEDMRATGMDVAFDLANYEGHENLKLTFPKYLAETLAKDLAQG